MISTGRMIYEYLDANGFTIGDLVEASGLSARTLYRIITSDDSKLPYKVAEGVNKLLPELGVTFLMKYDAAYQIEKINAAKEIGVPSINDVIREYRLDKLYRGENDKIALFNKGVLIFGEDNIRNGFRINVDNLSYNFSLAKNNDNRASLIWLKAAYEEYQTLTKPETFKEEKFLKMFEMDKKFSGVSEINSVLFNMRFICKECGINFYFRPSIPNSRVKAVALKDKQGFIYIFVSDLFKCVENLWLAFIHEIIHIYRKDYEKVQSLKEDQIIETENYVDLEVIGYYTGIISLQKEDCNISVVFKLSKDTNTPANIVAEIVRYLSGVYSSNDVNKLIHYYKSDEVNLNE